MLLARAALFLLIFTCAIAAHAAVLVNINTADANTLDALPGIGPAKAAAIVQYREDHGPFAKIEDIENVSGIGPATFAKLSTLITVGSAPTAEMKPSTVSTRTTIVNGVDAIPVSDTVHENSTVSAPVAATNTSRATGAAYAAVPRAPIPAAGLLRSPWTLAFLGLLAAAGGALMIF